MRKLYNNTLSILQALLWNKSKGRDVIGKKSTRRWWSKARSEIFQVRGSAAFPQAAPNFTAKKKASELRQRRASASRCDVGIHIVGGREALATGKRTMHGFSFFFFFVRTLSCTFHHHRANFDTFSFLCLRVGMPRDILDVLVVYTHIDTYIRRIYIFYIYIIFSLVAVRLANSPPRSRRVLGYVKWYCTMSLMCVKRFFGC